jgi:cardiolipin synthase A/B
MSERQRKMSAEIDHRGDPLGAAWVPGKSTRPRPERWQSGVCASGRGRVAANRIVEAIRRAHETVIVTSFLLSDQEIARALLEATRDGVRADVLLAAERVKKEPKGDEDFDQRMYEAEKKLLRDIAGHALVRSAGFFHAKLVLVDAPAGEGFLLTANLTTEALERNEELVVELDPEQRAAIHGWLSFAFWELAENEMPAPGPLERIGPAGWVKRPTPAPSAPVTAPGSTALREAASGIVERARQSLTVASFGWADEHAVVRRIIERARQGLRVTVLARPRPSAMKALVALREAGATVLGFPYLHAKALWSDAGEALVMSANLEVHGLDEGFEVGAVLGGARAEAVKAELAAWAEGAPFSLETGLRVGDVRGKVKLWGGRSLDEVDVEDLLELDLGRVAVPSADRLDATPPLLPPRPGRLAHRTVARWVAELPALDPKAPAR